MRYSDRLTHFKLRSLKERRKIGDLSFIRDDLIFDGVDRVISFHPLVKTIAGTVEAPAAILRGHSNKFMKVGSLKGK